MALRPSRVQQQLSHLWDAARPGLARSSAAAASSLGRGLAFALAWAQASAGRLAAVGWRDVRPGWYVLILGTVYSLVVSVQLGTTRGALAEADARERRLEARLAERAAGLTWPIVGARAPDSDENLPGSPRAYRKGVAQGFVFTGTDSGVPVAFGTPVTAAGDGEVTRADLEFREATPEGFAELLKRVAGGASAGDLDRLRGRQVWVEHPDGTVTRYGHLSGVAANVRPGATVSRGQIIGAVGNSGTLEGALGTRRNARLQFEVWPSEDRFLGSGLRPQAVRAAAAKRVKPWP